MADDVLALEAVTKSFAVGTPVEVEVLHGIDLTLARGEFVALIGPSGSGKSTLLNLIGLLDRPTAGRIALAGAETTRLDDRDLTRLRGRTIGFVFQYHHLISAFTAEENVMMPLLVDRGFPDATMRARARDLLERFHLGPWAEQGVASLSGGQQQRVAIARALAMDPALVLADEPTGNLDTRSSDVAFDLMREINRERGTTFLIVTHDPRLAARCDRIVEVVDGRLVSDRPNVATNGAL
ncbi:MAG: ABC transporter ATP-binding protein [Hyphomicrobiales bacterium]|nr:ABC transporter ATP-binding protein [Hyphomicrobiales bacterium]